jgi:hypothetical protein
MIEFLSDSAVFGITLVYVSAFMFVRYYIGKKLDKYSDAPALHTYLFKPLPMMVMFLIADWLGDSSTALKAVATTLCLFIMCHAAYKIGGLLRLLASQRKQLFPPK